MKHKTDHMVNVLDMICTMNECLKKASYGYPDRVAEVCAIHRRAGMIESNRPRCQHAGCLTGPSYALPGMNAILCAKHKQIHMINVISRHCAEKDCTSLNPCFNLPGVKPGIYCTIHKKDNMVDVTHKRCKETGCNLQPAYDIKGGKGTYCATHKLPGMIDIKNPYCAYTGCLIVNPIFNLPGAHVGKFCITHKDPGMVDVKHHQCEEQNCTTRPTYNVKGEITGRFCTAHKKDGMIDVNHPPCAFENCLVRPNFAMKGEKGQYCAAHKQQGMVDVMNNICKIDNCTTRSRYGRPGHMITRCTAHREKGMIAFSNARCKDCKQPALWGKNDRLLHCEAHKQDDEINMAEQPCVSCGLTYILTDGHCEHCKPESFVHALLFKQNALMGYLDQHGLQGNATEKMIEQGACGKERPDRMFDLGDKVIILECDEHQHKDRTCLCEQTRMVNIGQSFGGISVYFIRFNPDEYAPQKKREKQETLIKRYELCGDILQDIIKGNTILPTALVATLYLFFDGWAGLENQEWQVITAME